jgi:eukaryotic-like serine/threonine-protein kinase
VTPAPLEGASLAFGQPPKISMSRSSPPPSCAREIPADPFAGSRYRALSKLASGSKGDLYVVEHIELGKRFAAKLLRRELEQDPRLVDRLRLEAQSLGSLRHPNVVAVTGFDRTSQGLPFIVMELLKGRTLADELAECGALPVERAVDLTEQLLGALEAVHELGILHRNIEPNHIFLHQPPTGPARLKLLGFGLARVQSGVSERAPSPLAVPTKTGAIIGTRQFISPEAARGLAVDTHTDIYQVGLVLYLMLTGRDPFDPLERDASVAATELGRLAHVAEAPNPPSRHFPGRLPTELDGIVLRALAKNPEDRFESATEFRRQLGEVGIALGQARQIQGQQPARRDSAAAPPGIGPRVITRVLLFLALAVLGGLLVVALGHIWERYR